MHGYKPVEIEMQVGGFRRRLRVQVDQQTLSNTESASHLLGRLFERLRDDMKAEGII